MKTLPIGIQDFEKIRTGDYLYVDKTQYYQQLFALGTFYFLSRPRRFGKSLMLSTLKYLYQGKKELFKGLWIEDKWDWDKTNAVIHVDLSKINTRKSTLEKGLMQQIQAHADSYGIELKNNDAATCFQELIIKLAYNGQEVVVLIDEYDKPITDYINEPEISGQHIKELKSFYGILKGSDHYLHKVIITGVSKYGKVSIFSDLNNLNDLSISPHSNMVCGYTQGDLEYYFQPYFKAIMIAYELTEEELLQWIKIWYNGYSWNGVAQETMYNPFSILNFFYHQRFNNYWFETGTPTFLTELMVRDKISPETLEQFVATESIFSTGDIYNLDVLSLLMQTGYLTIKNIKLSPVQTRYTLGYPNKEVRLSFSNFLLAQYMGNTPTKVGTDIVIELQNAIHQKNWSALFDLINKVFASVPYQIFNKTEAYYHSLVHVTLTLSGYLVLSELSGNRGRIDTVLETEDIVIIFEFKMDSTPQIALAQIHEKKYSERYAKADKPLVLIGVNFDSQERTIKDWIVEE